MQDKSRILVIFDLDDTLIQTRKAFEPHENAFLRSYGLFYSSEEVREKFVGIAYESFVKTLRDDFRRAHGRDVPPAFEQDLLAMYGRAIEGGIERTDGADDLLQWLRDENVSHCIATNSRKAALPRKLEKSGLDAHFNFHAHGNGFRNAFSMEEVARGKPAPDLFWHVAREMGGFDLNQCVVVEDSATGITAGRAAGMYVIGFAGSYGRNADEPQRLRAAGAHVVVRDMADIRAIVAARRAPGFAAPPSP